MRTLPNVVLSVAVAGALASPAYADSAASGVLSDIVVTAQKRAENVQTIPFSIEAVTGADLMDKATFSLDSALADVPAVHIQNIAQGAQIFIRGVGSSIDPSFADPAVALMVDGVYDGRTESVSDGAYDIARVEVLRGPQGTLYGRNSTGGSINVITNAPELGVFNGYAHLTVGNYAERRAEAAINLPVSNDLAIRVAAYREKHNGYIDDGSDDADSWGARVKALWHASDKLSILAKIDVSGATGYGSNTVPVPGSAGNLTFPPPLFWTNFDPTKTPPWDGPGPIFRFPNGWPTASSSPWSNDPYHPPGAIERKSSTVSLQIDADVNFANLTVLPSYSKHENMLASSFLFGSLTGPYGIGYGNADYRSVEARLTSKAGSPTTWMVGAYWLLSHGGPTFSDQTNGAYLTNETYAPGQTLAAFAQVTQPITDHFRLTGGLRYSQDSVGTSFLITSPSQPSFSNINGTYSATQSASTYKVGFEYDLAPQSLLYAHIASGFKQGGLSPAIPPVPFAPENLTAYELGVKNRFLGNRLQVNASVFYYDYKNYQLSMFVNEALSTTGYTGSFPIVENAGNSKISGGELEVSWNVTPDDSVTASVTALDAKYGELVLPNNPFVNQGPYELEGHTMANAPKDTAALGYNHTFHFGNGSTLTAALHSLYSDAYYATPELYLPGAYQKAYTRSDASLRYSTAGDRWGVGLWAKNLENDAQTTYVFPAYRRMVTPPRTFGINFDTRF